MKDANGLSFACLFATQMTAVVRMRVVLPHLEGRSATGRTAQLKSADAPSGQ